MAYASWSVVFGEQPSAAKWNILGTNDAAFNAGTGIPSANSSAAVVATSQSTSSTSYADLATSGPAVTVTIGSTGMALVSIGAGHSNSVQNNAGFISFAISGATTVAAVDTWSVSDRTNVANFGVYSGRTFLVTGLSVGSTTFTAKYRTEANAETYSDRRISVVPL